MKRGFYIGALIVIFVPFLVRGQDRSFLSSQYIYNGLLLNPSFAGRHEVLSMTFSHRRQWMGFEGAPNTSVVSLHAPWKNKRIAVGLLMQTENIGARSYNNAFFNYAYRVSVGKGKLSMGLKAGLTWGRFAPIELGDGNFVFDDKLYNYTLPNFGIGTYYYSDAFFAGLSVPLLLGYEDGGEEVGLRVYHDFSKYSYYLMAGYTIRMDNDWKLQPSLLINYERSNPVVPDVNLNVIYRDFLTGGLSYRLKEAFVFMMSYRINHQMRAGLSYDFGLGELSTYHHGSMELTIQYTLGYIINVSNPGIF